MQYSNHNFVVVVVTQWQGLHLLGLEQLGVSILQNFTLNDFIFPTCSVENFGKFKQVFRFFNLNFGELSNIDHIF
jgi:hypothetical protein